MTRFTLVLKPNGKALLVTPEQVEGWHLEKLRRLWEEWKSENGPDVLFVSGTDVHVVGEIELEVSMTDQGKKDMSGKSPMQGTAEKAQKTTEQNQRDQMTPNTRDNAAKIGKGQKRG